MPKNVGLKTSHKNIKWCLNMPYGKVGGFKTWPGVGKITPLGEVGYYIWTKVPAETVKAKSSLTLKAFPFLINKV